MMFIEVSRYDLALKTFRSARTNSCQPVFFVVVVVFYNSLNNAAVKAANGSAFE